MVTIRNAAIAAIVLACPFAAPVAAETREPVTARVAYAGLDLASAEGRRVLDARLRLAVSHACAPRGTQLIERRDSERCRREMHADAATKLAAMISPERLASLGAAMR